MRTPNNAPIEAATIVTFRLIPTGETFTALVTATTMANIDTITAFDLQRLIAADYGVTPDKIELQGRWGRRLGLEGS